MSHSTSRGRLISTVITSAIHHHADINVPSRSVEHMSGVLHVGTREQSSEWYSGWKPEDRDGDDRSLLTLTRTMYDRERRRCTGAVPGPLA